MKKIFFYIIALTCLIITSCNDDSSRFVDPIDLENKITAELTSTRTTSFSGDFFPVSLTLPQSFDKDGVISVTATTFEGNSITSKIDLPANTTTVNGVINMPNSSVSYNLFTPVVSVADVKVSGIDLGEGNNGSFGLSSNTLELPYNTFFGEVEEEGINISLDWDGTNAEDLDIDFRVFGPSSGLRAETTGKPESTSDESDDLNDGVYQLVYQSFSTSATPVQLRLIVRTSKFSEIVTVDLPNLVVDGGWFLSNVIFTFEKTTTKDSDDNDVVTYTIL